MALREQYKIREFQQARKALDGYYTALNTLAIQLKRKAPQSEVDEQVHNMREARARLARSMERLGFQVVDIDGCSSGVTQTASE